MKNTFLRNQKTKIEFSEEIRNHVSSVSVPEKLLSALGESNGIQDLHNRLKYLLNKFRNFIALGEIPINDSARLKYQERGQSLVIIKFRPFDKDWAELGIWANGLGVTKCWLFTFLLELDLSLLGEFFEIPAVKDVLTTITKSMPRVIWRISGKDNQFYRILHFRV